MGRVNRINQFAEHGFGPFQPVGDVRVGQRECSVARQRAVELIESDPYFKSNPRSYRLLSWGKALPQFQTLM